MFLMKVTLALTIALLAMFQAECTHRRPTLQCHERSFVVAAGSCVAFENPCEDLRWEAGDTFGFRNIDPERQLDLTVNTEPLLEAPTREFCVAPGTPPSTGLIAYVYSRGQFWGESVFDITVTGTAPAGADVGVTISDSGDPVPVTGPLTYTLVVTNNGPLAATGIRLSYPLPLGTEINVNLLPSTCMLSLTNVLTCDFGAFASGNSATLQLPLFSLPPGTMTSTATVMANENDTNSSNNTDTETTTVVP